MNNSANMMMLGLLGSAMSRGDCIQGCETNSESAPEHEERRAVSPKTVSVGVYLGKGAQVT